MDAIARRELSGDCDVHSETLWDGNIEMAYTSCAEIPAAATFIVKVSDITGIKNCPLFDDWVFSVGCEDGVCPLNFDFEISLDMCDLIAAIATGGAATAAKTAAKAVGKTIGKNMKKEWMREQAQKAADNIGNKVEKEIRNSDVGQGLCADIEASIGIALQCIFNTEESVKIPGLQEVLEIFNGGISLQFNVEMEFVIATQTIRNVAVELGFGVDLPETHATTWGITILAKTIDEIPTEKCDKDDFRKIAKEMSAGITISESGLSGNFQITCGDSEIFKAVEEIGKKLKEGAEEVGKAIDHASGEVKESLEKAKESLEDVCKHVKSQKDECHDVSEDICEWIGRRQLKTDDTDAAMDVGRLLEDIDLDDMINEMDGRRNLQTDRRNLFLFGRRRRRWSKVCETITKTVCDVVDVIHC